METSAIKTPTVDSSYELIDSGEGEKLERFGDIILRRPDPEALWRKEKELSVWKAADATYVRSGNKGSWRLKKNLLPWTIEYQSLPFIIEPTSFKHVGLFPEQAVNWKLIKEVISKHPGARVLNLFAYTGGASMAALQNGGVVTHLDASKSAVAWAKKNVGLMKKEAPTIRYIVDDVIGFCEREIRRGNTYDIILLDPPEFGHGPKRELWKIEKDMLILIDLVMKLLSQKPYLVLINGYTAGYSAYGHKNLLLPLVKKYGGTTGAYELGIKETDTNRVLPQGVTAYWSSQ